MRLTIRRGRHRTSIRLKIGKLALTVEVSLNHAN